MKRINPFSVALAKPVVALFLWAGLSLGIQSGGAAQIRSGAAYLKILPGARQQAMSGTISGLVDETYAYYANPAATGFLREWQWSLTYTKWIADIYNMSANYGQRVTLPWAQRGRAILGLNYLGVREFDSSKGTAPPASASNLLMVGSLGFPLEFVSPNFSVGASLKYFHSTLDQFSAGALMTDVGVLWRSRRFELSKNRGLLKYGIFSAGASISQLGQPIRFISQKTPLPLTFRSGIAFYAGSHNGLQVQLAADYTKVRDEVGAITLGGEISLGQIIAIRGGYNFKNNLLSKYTFGMGIRLDDYSSPLRNLLPGRKHALKIDMAALQNMDFFSNAYRGTVTDIPIGPEYFEIQDSGRKVYTTRDSIQLYWQATKDPDLFDDVRDGIYVTTDRDSLIHWIRKAKKALVDFAAVPVDASFFSFGDTSAIRFDKKENLLNVELQPQPAGDYYWTAWAVDTDGHVRFANYGGEHVAHFRVVPIPVPPDTAADLKVTKTQRVPPLRLDIHFAFDSAKLKPESKELLNMLGSALNSREFLPYDLILGGHTDQRGTDAYNLKLSQRRVNSAKDYLIAVPGVDSSRITAIGYGESRPIILHPKTEAEYAVNRRVEMELRNPVRGKSTNLPKKNLRPAPKTLLAGGTFEYQLVVTNSKRNSARSVNLKDHLPEGFTLVSSTPKPDTVVQQNLFWKWPTLQPGAKDTVVLKVKTPNFVENNPQRFLNWAQVSAENDTNWHNDLDSVKVFVLGTPDTVVHLDSIGKALLPDVRRVLASWAKFVRNSPNSPLCIEAFVEPEDSLGYAKMLNKVERMRDWILQWIQKNSTIDLQKLHVKATIRRKKQVPPGEPIFIHARPCEK